MADDVLKYRVKNIQYPSASSGVLPAPPLPSGNGLCPRVPHKAGGQGVPSKKSHALSLCCGVSALPAGLPLPLPGEG